MVLPENRLSESYHLIIVRRMATWIALIYVFLFVGILFGLGISWLNSKTSIFPGSLPLTVIEMSFGIGLLSVLVPTLFCLVFQPQIFDWTLNIHDTTDSELLNEKLELLQRFSEIQRLDRGLLSRRVEIYLSDEISMNALTYGGFIKAPRVVFATDLFTEFTDAELQGVLCHELSHVHYGDYFLSVGFHYLLRLFDILFFPFRFINTILKRLIALTFIIPFIGVFFRAILYVIVFASAGLILPVWLVKALFSLQCQIREYVADDYAVRLMDDADGILTSLMKLENSQIKVFDPAENEEQAPEDSSPEEDEKGIKESDGEPKTSDGASDGDDSSEELLPDKEQEEHQTEGEKKDEDAPVKRVSVIEKIKQNTKKLPIKGKYRRYATVVYEVGLREPDTTIQRIYAFIQHISESHPPGEFRWRRIARVGFQIESEKDKGVV